MSPPMPRGEATVLVRLRAMSLGVLCLLILMGSHGATHRARAQEVKKSPLRVFLSFKKDGVQPEPGVQLRPNLTQEVFVYVLNNTGEKQSATVDLLSGDKVVYTTTVKEAPNGVATLVEWPAPAPDKAAPAEDLAMPLTVRIKDKDGAERKENVIIAQADDYLKVDRINYYPPEEKKVGGRIEMAVGRKTPFSFGGPPSKVKLELRSDLIENFAPGKSLKGNTEGPVSADGTTVTLNATDLRFTSEGFGYVNVTVDGVPRALVFRALFPLLGDPTTPAGLTSPVLSTSLPRYLSPQTKPYPITIESGGVMDADCTIKLERLASEKEGTYNEVKSFSGRRQEKMGFGKTGPNGGLLFTPAIKNWTTDLDLSGLTGSTKFRLRLLNSRNEVINAFDGSKPLDRNGKASPEVVQDVTIDGVSPVLTNFNVEGKKLRAVRGRKLVVQANCTDAESKVAGVVFYLGKVGADGKMPPAVPTSVGTEKDDLWKGEFVIPSDTKGPLDVSVRATDLVGNEATAPPLLVEVVDPDPTDGTIRGRVFEKEVPVDNIKVRLYSEKGLHQIVRTKDGGQFTFEKLRKKDGKYRVVAKRETNNATAEQEVTMKEYKAEMKDNQPLELILQTPEAKGAKKARISGVVREGDRPQAGLVVTLTDATSNKALLTIKSDAEGKYEFKDLNPGKYKVSASKSASRTKGESKPEDLKAAENKTGVDIKLYR